MFLQLGKHVINLTLVHYIAIEGTLEQPTAARFYFSDGDVLDVTDADEAREFSKFMRGLKFGVGVQTPKMNGA